MWIRKYYTTSGNLFCNVKSKGGGMGMMLTVNCRLHCITKITPVEASVSLSIYGGLTINIERWFCKITKNNNEMCQNLQLINFRNYRCQINFWHLMELCYFKNPAHDKISSIRWSFIPCIKEYPQPSVIKIKMLKTKRKSHESDLAYSFIIIIFEGIW